MPIISISLNKQDLQTLNRLQKAGGFANRSELLRQAIQTLATELQDLETISGKVSAVLTIVYGKKGKGIESNFLLHRQAKLIDALLHSHTVNGECIEVIVVNGPADDVKELVKSLKGNRKIVSVKVAIIGE
ncbi:MAG: CopG family ribbon-helix-helix protein [Candidatus Hermodarchaeia archaeon]|jgi:CopG family nickel-responsive transcriptional regulator